MALQRHVLFFCTIVILSFSNTISCFKENSLHSSVDDHKSLSGYYDSSFGAHPSYMSTIQNVKLTQPISLRTQLFGIKRLQVLDATSSSASVKTFSVDDFGAKGNGAADDTEAFEKAWQQACYYNGAVVLVVPNKKSYLVRPITFKGSCKSHITMQIYGTIKASGEQSDYDEDDSTQWLVFDNVENLLIQGPGTIDGNGETWWQSSCKKRKAPCNKHAPTAVTFSNCNNLVVRNVNIQNAQQMHVRFEYCTNVVASHLTVTAPEDSPNTDGIHVTSTQNITISSCVIGTGDDCISIVDGSQKVLATDITCGPGHGISIGSLGEDRAADHVSQITVNGAKFSGTSNGVRIKTWQGGSGLASNIIFQNMQMNNVENPIIIDQNYCDRDDKSSCKQQSSAVKVQNVLYQNIRGTSALDAGITFNCSKAIPCQGIVLQNIQLQQGKAQCSNVKLAYKGVVSPKCPREI